MDTDEALCSLGKFGKWQIILYITISIANNFPACWHMLAIVFLGGIPPHRCKLPEGLTENSIAAEETAEGVWQNSSCKIYPNVTVNNATQECPEGWDYQEDYGLTIVSMWDLVCQKSYMVDLSQTIMVIGVMCGAMVFSMSSDFFGRKPTFLFAQWAMVIIGVITAFTDNYYFFVTMRFLAGMCQQGIILTGFVMACELFPAKYRTFAGTIIELFWATAMCILPLVAYYVRNWRYLQLALTLPGLLTIGLFWFLPESIPWLVAKRRYDEAEDILRKAAKFNKVSMPLSDKILTRPEGDKMIDSNSLPKGKLTFKENVTNCFTGLRGKCANMCKKTPKNQKEAEGVKYTLLDVFRHRKLALYALIMCFLWFVNSLVYYGLSLSTGVTAGDRFLNFFLSAVVEIPAYTACIFVLAKWGRRWPLCIFHIIAGVALGILLFIPNMTAGGTDLHALKLTFNTIGKFGITGSFGTVFLYAPEIFPTTLRNQAMGVASVGGRLGNMLAPFASSIARIYPSLPGVLFGLLSIIVGLLALYLPETLDRPLPETIEDINKWTRTIPKKPKQGGMHELVVNIGNDVTDAKANEAL